MYHAIKRKKIFVYSESFIDDMMLYDSQHEDNPLYARILAHYIANVDGEGVKGKYRENFLRVRRF